MPELFVNAEGAAMTRAGFEYILDKHVSAAIAELLVSEWTLCVSTSASA